MPSPDPTRGTLFLIPVPLGSTAGSSAAADCLPAVTLAKLRTLRHFIVESAKSARAFLKPFALVALAELDIRELPDHDDPGLTRALLDPLGAGHDMGLLSEAGMPCIADPGAAIVAAAHAIGARVVPLPGSSAILLALAASGLAGQHFAFLGYLPVKDAELRARITTIEQTARRLQQTQIFIEAPYRNDRLLRTLLDVCAPETRIAVACDLTLPTEEIRSMAVHAWRRSAGPALDRRPAVFLLGS